MMKVALKAAEELEKEGVSAEVIDLRTIRPLDWRTILDSVKKTNRLVIVEEQWPFASVSSEISYRIQKEGFEEPYSLEVFSTFAVKGAFVIDNTPVE